MKRRLIICLGFLPVFAYSQSLSVEELIHKKENQTILKQYDQKIINQQFENQILKLDRLPVFYIDANLQRNLIIPTTPVPAIAFDPNAKEGAILPLKFSTKWNAKAGVQLEWQLFDPSSRSKKIANDLNTEKATLTYANEEVKWRKDAILAYAAVVLATEQYAISIADSTNFAQILQVIQNRFQEGRVSNAEYLTAQQELERKIIRRHESWSVLQESTIDLSKYTNLDQVVSLGSNLAEIEGYIQKESLASYDIALLQIDKKIVLNQNQDIRRQLLPTLSMNGFYGQQFFSNDLNLTAKDAWYGSSFVNLSLKVPISAYFSQGIAFKKVMLQEQLMDYQIREEEAMELNDYKKKQVNVLNLKKRILGLEKIEQLAISIEKEQLLKLEAGRILLADYQRANSDVLKAKQDIWQAKYDLLTEMLN